MKPKRAAIYTRVSLNSQNTTAQRAELTEFAAKRGWDTTYYTDEGQSGAKESRPGLDAMLRDVRRRKVDVVVVWALDRLARSLRHLLTLAEEFNSLGVDLIALNQNIDTSTPGGRFTYAVLGAVAELEREFLRARVKSGMAAARRAGKRIGRPPLREFTRPEVEQLSELRRQGASIRALSFQFETTQWMVNQLLGRTSPTSQKGILLRRPETEKRFDANH